MYRFFEDMPLIISYYYMYRPPLETHVHLWRASEKEMERMGQKVNRVDGE